MSGTTNSLYYGNKFPNLNASLYLLRVTTFHVKSEPKSILLNVQLTSYLHYYEKAMYLQTDTHSDI